MGPLLSLARKEIEECVPSFLLGTVALVGFTVIGLKSRLITDAGVIVGCAFGAVILALLVSMGITAPERSEGSTLTLKALPVNPKWVMLVKLAVASLMVVLVIAITGIAALAMAGGREVTVNQITGTYVAIAMMVTSQLAWMVAFNVRMRGEGAAGLVSIGALLLLIVIMAFSDDMTSLRYQSPKTSWVNWWLTMPAVNQPQAYDLPAYDFLMHLWPPLAMAASLWLVAAWRFARPERSRG